MTVTQLINQRDLRLKSKEIMDAVELGQEFLVTRDGRQIGELIPLRHQQRFVSRTQFAAMSASAPSIDLTRFRADLDLIDQEIGDPYDR